MSTSLNKIGSCKYEIPQNKMTGMRVPGIIYANEELVKGIQSDESLSQVANVAKLPGIMNASLAMPDIHLGYGFPIGGVAAFDLDEGIISPGGVGYDINCLRGDTRVLNSFGAWERISALSSRMLIAYDSYQRKQVDVPLLLTMTNTRHKKILFIETECGKEIFATPDHPLLTASGMKEAGKLNIRDKVVVKGYEGVEYTRPKGGPILSAEILNRTLNDLGITNRGSARSQLLSHIDKLNLTSISLDDPRLPIIIKIMGLVLGDGTIPKNIHETRIYGKREDLEDVKEDLARIGVNARIYSRHRAHKIKTVYDTYNFEFTEYSLKISSKAFGIILAALGVPTGNKSLQAYSVPEWIMHSENWQKRLFIASYFGAEMSAPGTSNDINFTMPAISVNKVKPLSYNSIEFLSEIRLILNSLGVKCSNITRVEGYSYSGKRGKTAGYRLAILSNTNNLIKFFSTVSYEYNRDKARLAGIAALYLNKARNIRSGRDSIRAMAMIMQGSGKNTREIIQELEINESDKSFVKHSIWGRNGKSRLWKGEKFSEFVENSVIAGDFALDEVKSIKELPFDGVVYDLTVNNSNHNFIANGIVVSNCGVRLIRTDLFENDAKPKIKDLVDRMFENVPSGVGREGKLNFNYGKMENFLDGGVKYAVEQGYGWDRDTERIEEEGSIKFSDRTKVSQKARSRGFPQLGTLGAGNHFLEVQKVDKIYDVETAKKFGLFSEGQVTIMVHTGSRGFGHQVATDYLEVMEDAMKKYKISVPDKQLASAPFQSKEAQDYMGAMGAAANFGFSNRQIITHWIRESFKGVFNQSPEDLGMDIVYDVCHNIAKVEDHSVQGTRKKVVMHRKGATRAFPAGRQELSNIYRDTGHPVIIPGTMGTSSYVLVGTPKALEETFGSTCHGSGRTMSRSRAIKQYSTEGVRNDLERQGIYVRAATKYVLQEEAPKAYKDVDQVVESVECAGLSKIVARLRPIGVMKG